MKKIFTILFYVSSISFGQIISQYVETNSGTTPKGIEIYNNTTSVLDFSVNNLVIEKGVNGGTPSTDFSLTSGTLEVNDVIVIGTSDMQTVTESNGAVFYEKSFTFNGDDALVVKYGGVTTDVFGIPGTDPGSNWNGNGVSTQNQNISLNYGIVSGDLDGWTDPSERFYTVSTDPIGTNGLEGFGDPEPPLPVELTTFSATILENNVMLNWETATEVNNYGFNIERKVEIGEWSKVGFVEGHGNSNSPKTYSFADKSIIKTGKYSYRLKQIDIDGQFEYSDEIEVNFDTPTKFSLGQNYPNPFNPETSIKFTIPLSAQIKLSIFNVLGEEVATLLNENISAGEHVVNFNASALNSGIYFYQLTSDNFTQIRKMMLVK